MIVSVRFTPRLFGRTVVASFKERPASNGLAFGAALVLAALIAGPLAALKALAAIIGIGASVLFIGGLVMYILYRNKRKFVPVTYDLTGKALKITFGDRTSLCHTSHKLPLDTIERVWFKNRAIHLKRTGFIYPIVLPEKSRSRFIEQMRQHGWFERRTIEPKARLIGSSANIALYLLIAAMIVAIYPTKPNSDIAALSNTIARRPLTAPEVLIALNSQRNALNLGTLQADTNLSGAAQSACHDMTDHMYFGDLSGQQGDVYTRGHYSDSWVVEAGAAVKNGTTPDQVVSHWVNSGITSDAVLQSSATRAGAAICKYTVNGSYDKIVVVELGS